MLIEKQKETEMARKTFIACHASGGTVGLMNPADYAFLYEEMRCQDPSTKKINWPLTLATGIRIFTFKDGKQNTAGCCGNTTDLQQLIDGGRISIEWLEDGAFYVPFSKSLPLGDEMFAVTPHDFHEAFGDDLWTSIFPRRDRRPRFPRTEG